MGLGTAGRLQHDARRRPFGNRIGQRLDAVRLVPVTENHSQRRDVDLEDLARHANADEYALRRQFVAVLSRCRLIVHTNLPVGLVLRSGRRQEKWGVIVRH
ncbi:hypothetical protein GPU89_00650 [Burkholderia cepacia]|nr:hypothetical protein [Burkholderia cepacia]